MRNQKRRHKRGAYPNKNLQKKKEDAEVNRFILKKQSFK